MRMFNRSPLFYMGDKYKLLPEISKYFPKNINRFIEPFTGGGSVYLNIDANEYLLNDIDKEIVALHKFLIASASNPDTFFKKVIRITKTYNLSRSFVEDIVPENLKKDFVKTYYAKFNKPGYLRLRDNFNKTKNDYAKLYVLLIYGFNRILRFNSEGNFNLPVGNVDFNKNTASALNNYFETVKKKKIKFHTKDFSIFLNEIKFKKDDFVYLDPPYLITFGEYNKFWNEAREEELLSCLDLLTQKKVNWALSNVTDYEKAGENLQNKILKKWMKKYNIKKINSNYISFHNNQQKKITEVLISNF
jgi:DNA adenine methylase